MDLELIKVVTQGNLPEVSRLLSLGVDVETSIAEGYTSIIIACTQGHLNIIKLLVKFGANVRVRTHNGTGCILCADYQGHFSVVKYLVEIDPEMLLSRPFEAQVICRQAIDRGD